MKTILLILVIVLIGVTVTGAAERPIAEIVDYGIYTGGQNRAIAETNATTGLVLQGLSWSLDLKSKPPRFPLNLENSLVFDLLFMAKKRMEKLSCTSSGFIPK